MEARTHQQPVRPGVRADVLAEHLLEHLEATLEVAVRGAGVHQVAVDVGVEAQVVPPAQVLADVEGLRRLVAAVRKLHQHGEREVARGHARVLHVLEHGHAAIVEAVARAAVEQRVVGDLVRQELLVQLHVLQHLERLVQAVLLAVALQHRAVRDDVRLDLLPGHVLQQRRDAAHLAAPGAGVDQRVVCHNGELHLFLQHLLVHGPDAVEALLVGEALEDRAVNHGVHQAAGLRVRDSLADELVAGLDLAVGHQRLHHAAQRDAGRHDVARLHLAPRRPDARKVLHVARGADDAAEGVRALHLDGAAATLGLQLLLQQVAAADADAGLAHGAQQHLIHGVGHVVQHIDRALDVGMRRVRLDALEQDGARHVVRVKAVCLHLLHERPCCLDVLLDGGVDELVVRHAVRRVAGLAHGVDAGARATHVMAVEVGLDHRVVRDDVGEARLCCIGHGLLRNRQVLGRDARVDERVEEAGGLLRARAEDGLGARQAVLGAEALQQRHAAWADLRVLGSLRDQAADDLRLVLAECGLGHEARRAAVGEQVGALEALGVDAKHRRVAVALRQRAVGGAEAHRGGGDLGRRAGRDALQHALGQLRILARQRRLGRGEQQGLADGALADSLVEDALGASSVAAVAQEGGVGGGRQVDLALGGKLLHLAHDRLVGSLHRLDEHRLERPVGHEAAGLERFEHGLELALLAREAGNLCQRLLRRGRGAADGGCLPNGRQVLDAAQRALEVAPGDRRAQGEHRDAGRRGLVLGLRLVENRLELVAHVQAEAAAQQPGGERQRHLRVALLVRREHRGNHVARHALAHALEQGGEHIRGSGVVETLEMHLDLLAKGLGAGGVAEQRSKGLQKGTGSAERLCRPLTLATLLLRVGRRL
mmetsp:Transcript_4426/g.11414  ORF Transcript_4426/g.11414 Transcript_4426/m.11414 type:complete len:881 (+) Transcript_4426:531-3173(+)